MNEVSGRKESGLPGKPKGTVEERKNVWYLHYQNHLGKPPTVTDANSANTVVSEHIHSISDKWK